MIGFAIEPQLILEAIDSEQICIWADGTWCWKDELGEMTHMSDDYAVRDVSVDMDPEVVVQQVIGGY